MPRLSRDMAYLVRMPLSWSPGEKGIINGVQGDYEAALALFSHPANRAEALYHLGRWGDAVRMVDDDTSTGALVVRARALVELGLLEEAVTAARSALHEHACPPSGHEALADALWALEKHDEARASYRAFIEEVRLFGLLENGVPERLERARERLR